jgi:hypothetical protein
MSLLALIPIGLYALIATISIENAIYTEAKPSLSPEQKLTLKEITTPSPVMDGAKPLQTGIFILATSPALSDLVVKAPITNTLQMQAKHKRHLLPQVRKAIELSKGTMVNPRPHLSKTKTDDGGSYSAPLGLKDEFNNDWMK